MLIKLLFCKTTPGFGTLKLGSIKPTPGFGTLESGSTKTTPGFGTLEPGSTKTTPGFGTLEPGSIKPTPGFGTLESGSIKPTPGFRIQIQPGGGLRAKVRLFIGISCRCPRIFLIILLPRQQLHLRLTEYRRKRGRNYPPKVYFLRHRSYNRRIYLQNIRQ